MYALMPAADNLYGSVMRNDHLPLRGFAIDAQMVLNEILKKSSGTQHGYILEIDVDYPPSIQETPQSVPLAPSFLPEI